MDRKFWSASNNANRKRTNALFGSIRGAKKTRTVFFFNLTHMNCANSVYLIFRYVFEIPCRSVGVCAPSWILRTRWIVSIISYSSARSTMDFKRSVGSVARAVEHVYTCTNHGNKRNYKLKKKIKKNYNGYVRWNLRREIGSYVFFFFFFPGRGQ